MSRSRRRPRMWWSRRVYWNPRRPPDVSAGVEGLVVIETADGIFERPMTGPAPVPHGIDPGAAAELSVRQIGAGWGLPDFVFAPADHQVGSGRREISDGIIVCGRFGVVLQTKCRTTPGSNVDRERRWIHSAVDDAARQASGTLRTLRSAPQTMTSLRGVAHEIVAPRFEWLCVIIIDHEKPPAGLIVDPSTKDPTLVLLKSDWDFLFDHLRSTFAVVRYLRHAVQFESIELGTEWIRYGYFAFDSSHKRWDDLDPRILIKGAVPYHSPLLSLTPAMDDDGTAQAFYRMILDEVALIMMSDPELSGDPRLDVLAALDALPVSMRSTVARYILDSITELSKELDEGVKWLTRTIRGTADGTQLIYGACSKQFDGYRDFLQNRVLIRHHDLRTQAGVENCQATLAVVLTPRRDGSRPWDVTICRVAGDVDLDADHAQAVRDFWDTIQINIPRRTAARVAKRHRRARRRG